jgi:hypothetical protein
MRTYIPQDRHVQGATCVANTMTRPHAKRRVRTIFSTYFWRRFGRRFWAGRRWMLLATFLLALFVRTIGGATNLLYGADKVQLWNILTAISLILLVTNWKKPALSRRRIKPIAQRDAKGEDRRLERLITILALPVAVVTFTNMAVPTSPAHATGPTCKNARVDGVNLVAVTTGENGINARSGPGFSYPQTGRFEKGCTIGFDSYCIGAPVQPAAKSTAAGMGARSFELGIRAGIGGSKEWNETRWLLMPRHHGLAGQFARTLSGEPGEERFISAALVAPLDPWNKLQSASSCSSFSTKAPDSVAFTAVAETRQDAPAIATVDVGAVAAGSTTGVPTPAPPTNVIRMTAVSKDSYNIGFSLWITFGDDLIGEFDSLDAGAVNAGRLREYVWNYEAALMPKFKGRKRANMTVMAIPCLAQTIHAGTEKAATRSFVEADGLTLVEDQGLPSISEAVRNRLAETACAI